DDHSIRQQALQKLAVDDAPRLVSEWQEIHQYTGAPQKCLELRITMEDFHALFFAGAPRPTGDGVAKVRHCPCHVCSKLAQPHDPHGPARVNNSLLGRPGRVELAPSVFIEPPRIA